jgi:polysaccharide chain length determinant protein (PEP-CTERM system associated)
MLPGKKYRPEDIVAILWHRMWLIAIPVAVISAAAAVFARTLPDLYRSETLILVVPQRVPESYVRSTVTTRIEDRLQSITQQILSRTRLERIILDFNLYPKRRETGIMEDIVRSMRRDITVQVVKGDAFRVSYVGGEPRTVQKVTERLASLFIEENLRDREILAEGTNQFLESQLEEARQKLVDRERKIEEHRRQYSGEMPTQLQGNLQVIQNTQFQIQALLDSMARDRDRKLILERMLADMEAIPEVPPVPAAVGDPSAQVAGTTAAQQLSSAQSALASLLMRLKPEHPDVVRMQRIIVDLEKKAEEEALQVPLSGRPAAPVRLTAADIARRNKQVEVRGELQQLERDLKYKEAEERRLRGLNAQYQARVERTPTREAELAELSRDYETLQNLYRSMLAKKEESKIAANLERRQIGQQFKLLDPARVPEKPVSPNRPLIVLAGFIAGIAIGLAFTGFFEYRDSSFKTDDEIVGVLTLPVLASVPIMETIAERRRGVRLRILTAALCGSTVLACAAIVAYTLVIS